MIVERALYGCECAMVSSRGRGGYVAKLLYSILIYFEKICFNKT